MKRFLIFTFSIFLTIGVGFASYYADIDISVDESGLTLIDGVTNYEKLSEIDNSNEFTSKDGSVWTLNITIEEEFDNFIYKLSLPKYSEINYVKTTPTFRIAEEDNRIQIIGTGENRELVIVVQYSINSQKSFIKENYEVVLVLLFLILLLILRIGFGFKLRRKDSKQSKEEEKVEYDISILPERQKEIIKLIRKNGKMTQKELESKMKIPKSSVSRNVKTLIARGILKKERSGQSNYISLKD